ncbi:MAG: CDC48 family AAA ATPase [Nitrososphaerota archaeon]|nr:CDC48 family AAA ATPase [Nitrososphaerota archaeon]MDG6922082.1 CDC48 family AAA ATPase [Nitrososphaerota archaeon]
MVKQTKDKEVELRVAESLTRDVGRGIARVDPDIISKMGWTTGDAIEIQGRKKTYALLWPAQNADAGKGIIRIDGSIRNNAGIGIDDKVAISRIEAATAQSVMLAPTEPLRITGGEEYLGQLLYGRIVGRGDEIVIPVMNRTIALVVTKIDPAGDAAIVSDETQIAISEEVTKPQRNLPRVTYEDIGGLRGEITKVREMIELPMKHPELFERLGIEAPKGVLLHGPPGTGKTLLAKAVANETNAHFISISGPEIMGKYYGESEERLRQIFEDAEKNAPSILFIDEIDSIAPKREEVTGEVEKRVVAQLLALMDGMESRGKVVVIAATNRPNALDPALRRPGRFDREIVIGVPDSKGRLEILQIHTRGMPLAEDVDLQKLASSSHGFVGADLEALAKEAAMRSLRRVLPSIDLEKKSIPADVLNKIVVKMSDFQDALTEVEPSAMREVLVEVPNVRWSDVGGLAEIKRELQESIEWPLKYRDVFDYAKTKPPKGILLYGPPGTGKTLLAKAVANESEANFISIKGPELLSKWVGESERGVREVFHKARQAAPCIVFMDELDSLVPTRGATMGDSGVTERVLSQILTELDGLEELRDVVIVGATNRPDMIDQALLRPGRFDKLLYVSAPDLEARKEIFKIHLKGRPLSEDIGVDDLAKRTEGYSGADIEAVVETASMFAIREYIDKYKGSDVVKAKLKELDITKKHFDEAMMKVKPFSKIDLVRKQTPLESSGMSPIG